MLAGLLHLDRQGLISPNVGLVLCTICLLTIYEIPFIFIDNIVEVIYQHIFHTKLFYEKKLNYLEFCVINIFVSKST